MPLGDQTFSSDKPAEFETTKKEKKKEFVIGVIFCCFSILVVSPRNPRKAKLVNIRAKSQ